MTVRVLRAGVLSVSVLLLLANSRGRAQAPPPNPPPLAVQPEVGFVPPFEIMRAVRSAGFDPLAPPLREGTTYVLRATDFRGILMRVVVDARTGVIRDVNRIVPGPGRYGEIERPPYGPPPAYDPAGFDPSMPPPREAIAPPIMQPSTPHPIERPFVPLPRPRPAALASRKSDDGHAGNQGRPQPDPPGSAAPQINSETATAPASPPAPPKKSPAGVQLND